MIAVGKLRWYGEDKRHERSGAYGSKHINSPPDDAAAS